MLTFGTPDRIAIATLKTTFATLSVIGSSLIVYIARRQLLLKKDGFGGANISRRANGEENPTIHRLLLGMSVNDLLHSTFQAIYLPLMPVESGGFFASGNQQTCVLHGFFQTWGLAALVYNAGLAVYYVLMVRYNVPEKKVKQIFEPLVHLTSLMVVLPLTVSAIILDLYNPARIPEFGCWASPYPFSFIFDTGVFDTASCERGVYLVQWGWAFYWAQVFFMMVVTVMTISLVLTIRGQYFSVTAEKTCRETGKMPWSVSVLDGASLSPKTDICTLRGENGWLFLRAT